MTWENKPVWTEGMFLRPQHFQQFERFLGAQLEARTAGLRSFGWGFDSLEFDEGLLKTGKLGLIRASGAFDDGTPFRVPAEATAPEPLEIDSGIRNRIVHLCLPAARAGNADVALEPGTLTETRFVSGEFEAADTVHGQVTRVPLNVGRLQLQLKPEGAALDGYTAIPLARVIERRADDSVALDPNFIPTVCAHRASRWLTTFLSEIGGILHQRGQAIAAKLGSPRQASGAVLDEFGRLMLINGAEASLRQIAALPTVHPADLYRELVTLAGQLATYTRKPRRPEPLPLYNHRAIGDCFQPLFDELRRALNASINTPAEQIDLKFDPARSRWKGLFTDPSLLQNATYVLAVRSSADPEQVRAHLPNLIKIGAPDQLDDLVDRQVSGADIRPRSTEPADLPPQDGMLYFDVNAASQYWQAIRTSQAIGLHVGAVIPELQLQLWAIRSQPA